MNNVFLLLTLLSAGAIGVGMVALCIATAFNLDWDWPLAPLFLGFAGMIVFGVGFLLTAPPTPLSRGIIGDKREHEYTMMVMSGKVMIPIHYHDYLLVSTEGATCKVDAGVYPNYHVGDAVVCGWTP